MNVRATVVTLCLGLVATPVAAQRLTPVERYTLLRTADSAYRHRDYAGAVALYQRITADYPGDGDLWLRSVFASSYGGGGDRMVAAERAIEYGSYFFRERLAHEIARAHALAGNKPAAMEWIRRSLDMRYTPRTTMKTDSAFKGYHQDADFRVLAGMLPDRTFTRDEGLRYDLQFLAGEAKRLHTSFKRQAFSPAFEQAVKALDARIPTLTDRQVVVEFQRLVVLLEDGHTKVEAPARFGQLPIDLYLFSDGLFVVGGVGEGAALIGARVVRFGSRTVDEILTEARHYIHRDNDNGIKWIGAWMFTLPDYLQAMGGTTSPDEATLTVERRDGTVSSVRLVAGPQRYSYPLKLGPAPGSRAAPTWLQKVGTPLWFTAIPAAHAVYVQFNQVRENDGETFAASAAKIQRAVSTPGVRNLIVDVRHNTGGNSFLFPPLLRVIGGFQELRPGNRIFALTSRHTFSAAQNFSTNLERQTDAVFVGEPTGSSPNFVGEGPNFFELPYSGTRVTISSWYHQFSFWNDTRQWIAPDLPVELSSGDYFANRDPVLEAIVEIIRQRP